MISTDVAASGASDGGAATESASGTSFDFENMIVIVTTGFNKTFEEFKNIINRHIRRQEA